MTFVFAQAELLSVKSFLRQAIYVKNRLVNCKKKKNVLLYVMDYLIEPKTS